MEMFELRYFLAVANGENVNRAAERIHVSAGSLSKAIARLEDELKTPLFYKTGRQIRLTPEGQLLKKRASAILQLEEDTRLELAGKESGSLNLFLSAEEVLHASFGIEVAKKVDGIFPQVRTQFLIRHDAGVIDQVMQGEAQLGLITAEAPSGLASKVLARVEFVTAASKRHPLHRKFGTKPIPISEVLEHAFVAPESSILGSIRRGDSRDGWREDKLPRKIKYRACSLKLMESLVQDGLALAYLPDYFAESAGLVPLKITGCPFSCHQTVRVISRDPSALGWLGKIWAQL